MKNILEQILIEGGQLLLEYFNKPLEITQKESMSSVVTQADLAAEKLIVSRIEEQFPEHNVLSEECGLIKKDSEYTWVIDPLDGTSNFAAGIPWFGVLIALFENNEPILGGAYLPVQNEIYLAEKGKGAYFNGERLKLDVPKSINDVLFAFSADYCEDEKLLDEVLQTYRFLIQNTRNVRTSNCLIDLLYVSNGRLGGCINTSNRIWDVAAAGLIIEEAGGIMLGMNGQKLAYALDETALDKSYPVVLGAKSIVQEFLTIHFSK